MVSLHRYIRDSVYNIRIGEETIQATADHPFFISGRWLRVAELKVGDSVKTYDGSNLAIEQITVAPGRTTVYNFEVEDYHTYYVSNTKVLVHNDVPCPFKTVVEGKGLLKELEKAYGKQAVEEFEKNIKTRLAKGQPGGKVHDLKGDLKGWKAVDIPGTGHGRGGGRIIFRELESTIEIKGLVKGHDYTKILGAD